MNTINASKTRHSFETRIIDKALGGDRNAIQKLYKYLSSTSPELRQMIANAIHQNTDAQIWHKLIHCLALHQWNEHMDETGTLRPAAWKRMDQALTKLLTHDQIEIEKTGKESALREALDASIPSLRHASAYILGLRGDAEAIPALEEAIQRGDQVWQIRAIQALAELDDQRCGPALIKALTKDRGVIHREATKALNRLGRKATSAWVSLLNHPDDHIRWHATRGLGNIGDASAAEILAQGLFDETQSVRWATADVLARLGEVGVPATLKVLRSNPLTEPSRRAAYHALHGIASKRIRTRLKPVLVALRGPAASAETPTIASNLLEDLKEKGGT